MARLTIALAACLIPGALWASDTLLVFNNNWLASADPRTGGVLQYHLQIQGGGLAYDPAHNVVYTLTGSFPNPTLLSAIDTQTLHVSSVAITGIAAGQSLDSLAYDSVAGVLYATSGYYSPAGSQLYRIDTQTGALSTAGNFPGVGVTALTFDRLARALYGTATPGGYESSTPPRVVRIDPATGNLTVLYAGKSAYEFHDLGVIPGTLSFYTRNTAGLFARLDTVGGITTPLGNSTDLTGGPLFQDFDFAVTPPLNGPLSYSIQDICAPTPCAGQLLNDRGAVAGQIAGFGSSLFLASAGTGVVPLPGTAGLTPSSMNNNQDIVGFASSIGQAFLYSRSTAQLFNLNAVFGWSSGSADHINNRGDIVGNPFGGVQETIDGFPLSRILGITDAGILFAQTQSGGLVLFPGGAAYQTGLVPFVFNNSGQFLSYSSPGNPLIPAGGTALFTPGSGVRILPGNTLSLGLPLGLNDSGIALFAGSILDTSGAIPEISGGAVPLLELIPPGTGWSKLRAMALNNAGQILVQGTNNSTGINTSLLLTPNIHTAAAQTIGARLMRTTPGCGAERLNRAPFDCSKLLELSPKRNERE